MFFFNFDCKIFLFVYYFKIKHIVMACFAGIDTFHNSSMIVHIKCVCFPQSACNISTLASLYVCTFPFSSLYLACMPSSSLSVKFPVSRTTDVASFKMNLSIIFVITLIHLGGCCSAGSTSFDVAINPLTISKSITFFLGRFPLRQWPEGPESNVGVAWEEARQHRGVPVRQLTLHFPYFSYLFLLLHSTWINSLFQNILHELDEKFEVADESRQNTNFWMIVMAVFGLVSLVGIFICLWIMYARCHKSKPRDLEMEDMSRDPMSRRASRVEDMNITVKREQL